MKVNYFVGDSLKVTPEELGYEESQMFNVDEYISVDCMDDYQITSFGWDIDLGQVAYCYYVGDDL